MNLACSREEGKSGWKEAEPWAGSRMEEVRSWKWEEMTVVLVGPAAGLEENVRGGAEAPVSALWPE